MINNNYIQPMLATPASSCLTNNDLVNANVKNISIDLATILVRPGFNFLTQQVNLREYLAWNGKIIVNGSGLSFSNGGKIQINSPLDGSKYFFTVSEVEEFFTKSAADIILLPKNSKDRFSSNAKFYYAADEYKPGYGVYSIANDSVSACEFVNVYKDAKKYLIGSFDLNLNAELKSNSNLMLENTKPCTDAYEGIVYSGNTTKSILENSAEHEFTPLDDCCKCDTCQQGYTVAYLHHLFKHTPLLCQRLLISHNVFYASHLPSYEMTI